MSRLQRRLKRLERSISKRLPIAPLIYRRRFHAYCIGSAKSGTHSISGLFEKSYRAAHEPEADRQIRMIVKEWKGETARGEMRQFVKARDRRLFLEMESSQLNFFVLDYLLDRFPDARFILTIRDCYSWLDSILNNHLARSIPDPWKAIFAIRHGSREFQHSKKAAVLEENGFSPLEGYLSYWAHHNETVLDRVPPGRLLVVRTDRINDAVEDIARFMEISPESLDIRQSHLFRAPSRYGFVERIDRDFLEATAEKYCGSLMRRFFPDIGKVSDALAKPL